MSTTIDDRLEEASLLVRGKRAEQDLERTVDEIEHRIENAKEVVHVVRDSGPLLATVAAGVAGTAALALTWGTYRAFTAERRREVQIVRALRRVVRHPSRVARRRSPLAVLGELALLGAAFAAAAIFAKRSLLTMFGPEVAAGSRG